jgi:general nucleoside transport system permease protein
MHELEAIVAVLVATLRAATPLVFAATGELIVEKSGVLNLGVEGMMLVGAVTGFVATAVTGNPVLGLAVAMLSGMLMALIFGALTLSLMANQVATGLALTIFGIGLSALLGLRYVGTPIPSLLAVMVPGLGQLTGLTQQILLVDPLVWLGILLPIAAHRLLFHSRAGLVVRAVGESHDVAFALGYKVIRIRYLAVLFGGAMSGLAGGYLSLVYTPNWAENMTAGRGWIALALVVFATWKPLRVMAGAYLFGFVTIAQFQAQAFGVQISSHLMATLPYLATVFVLVIISRDSKRIRLNAPASLAKPFHANF